MPEEANQVCFSCFRLQVLPEFKREILLVIKLKVFSQLALYKSLKCIARSQCGRVGWGGGGGMVHTGVMKERLVLFFFLSFNPLLSFSQFVARLILS